ncbi:MAG: flagellar hook-associated protein FlgK [Clostridiales bacterium]|nr:flagellar hook-associated protein FlgK [Clostridiales bacterium]
MRPTFLGFETARKAIMASQKSLDIVGHNLGNVNTKGYTRQRVDLVSIATPSGGLRYSAARTALAGQGVHTPGVAQIRDPFLDRRFRELNASTEEHRTTSNILVDIENVIGSFEDKGLHDVLLDFEDKLKTFATDAPDRIEMANIALTSAKNVAQMLIDYDKKLTQIYDQSVFELETAVGDVNAIIDKLASLNQQIVNEYIATGETSLGNTVNPSYGPNELLDERNLLLDELSTYGDIKVYNNDDGSIRVEMADVTVVDGKKTTNLSMKKEQATGAVVLSFTDGNPAKFGAGAIKGYVEMINGNGPYAENSQSGEYGIPYYRSVINEFAASFSEAFNRANGAVDASGNVDFTSSRAMFVSSDGGPITAANIRVSSAWSNDPLMIARDPITDEGSLDPAQLLRLRQVFGEKIYFGAKGDFNGTLEEYISFYTNRLGQQTSFVIGQFEASGTITNSILTSRDAVSAVSLEEEGINMLNFQKWFNASSRLMTTLDEALDTIINSMGLVGR